MDRNFLKRLPRNYVSVAMIVLGAILMLYVATQYGQMYLEQRRMERAWTEEQQRLQVRTPADQSTEHAHTPADDGMVRLVIPKIDLASFIVEGTSRKALLVGPGHLSHSAEPGAIGNSVITAHRDTFFRHINELEKGDQIVVERGSKRFVYEVTGKKIVEPTDMSVTRATEDSQMTLITCYPTYYVGPAPKRLVVFSKLASQTDRLRANQGEVSEAEAASFTGAH